MATSHLDFDAGLVHGRRVIALGSTLLTGVAALLDTEFAIIDDMKTGDGSAASQFQMAVDTYGVQGVDANTKLANIFSFYNLLNTARQNSAALRTLLAAIG